jgi:hypothetical protein
MSIEKPSKPEDQFIHREEVHDIIKTKARKAKELAAQERAKEQQLHYMKCPKCGGSLTTEVSHAIEIDRCIDCSGVWLDAGELEKIAGEDSKMLEDIIQLFRQVGAAKPISDM